MVDAIHDGSLGSVETVVDPVFGVQVPTACPGVPSEILIPKNTWKSKADYEKSAKKLAALFRENFKKFEDQASAEIRAAGPTL
jgi:phosphoenolpyruvate carboxykinase (ATP)